MPDSIYSTSHDVGKEDARMGMLQTGGKNVQSLEPSNSSDIHTSEGAKENYGENDCMMAPCPNTDDKVTQDCDKEERETIHGNNGDCEMASVVGTEGEATLESDAVDCQSMSVGEAGSTKELNQMSDSEMSDYSNESSFDQSNLHLLIPEVELRSAISDDMSSHDGCDPLEENSTTNENLTAGMNIIENHELFPSSPAAKPKLSCPLCKRSFSNSKSLNSHVVKKHNTTLGAKFNCHICGASGGSRSSLKRHLRRTHKVTTFSQPELFTRKCPHCPDAFPSHMVLYEHLRASHQDELHKYYHCESCPAVIRAKASFIRHLRRSHPGQELAFLTVENCSLCDETFTSKQALQRHVKQTHPGMSYSCDQCDGTFKHNYLLTRHKMTHLADNDLNKIKRVKKRYKINCDECNRTYDSKKRLERHISMAHTNQPEIQPPKLYQCRICSVVSYSAKQNRKHYRRIHLKERLKVHCSQCNITFKTAEECAQHRVLHPTTCDVCKKQFLRRDSLREHLMIHSQPRHLCPHCPKRFTQSSNLKRHIRVHTGEKPYQCPFCNRRFSDKSACNSHIRVHTGAERSVCELCGASFSKKQRLNYHMKTHTGKGLIRCPICSRPHTNSHPLRKHVQTHCQSLTIALVSLGLVQLIQENPHLVIDSLNLLTEQALEQSLQEAMANGEISETDIKVEKPDSLIDCINPVNMKSEMFEFDESRALIERYNSPAAMSRLLKDIFKVQQVYATPKVPPAAELPNTLADELVKECLEVIMKAEPREADEGDSDEESVPIDPLDLSTAVCEEIPKIKISRKLDSEDKDGAVFVAEFIK